VSHVIHSINSTINGCCDHRQVIADEEHHIYAAKMIGLADALLFGRKTFDLLEAFWLSAAERSDLPNYMIQFAKSINGAKKYVSSNRSLKTDWPNCTLIPGDIRDNMKSLRAKNPGIMVIFGSPSMGRSLAEADEIDESHFLIQPLAADEEPRLFSRLGTPIEFRLIDVTTLKSGVLLTRYGRKA